MVDSQNHARIPYERVNADTGEEVPWDRMVKGYEQEDGKFIILTEEDLDVVQPKLTKTIEITEFVALDEIDPVLFDKPYYLELDKRHHKAYPLLREALRSTSKTGIFKVVIRKREYFSSLFVHEDVLMIILVKFSQKIRATNELELPPSRSKEWQVAKNEMDLATRLINEMTDKWQPDDFHDEYRSALIEFIERKLAGAQSVDHMVKVREDSDDGGGPKVLDLLKLPRTQFRKTASCC
jgi:DNA end-binding protein Ku